MKKVLTETVIARAWDLFLEGEVGSAKKLLDQLQPEASTDFSVLNLFGYICLEEEDYEKARFTYERYIEIARERDDHEQVHIGLHQLAMVYRDLGDYHKALTMIAEEEELIERLFADDCLKRSVNHYEQGYLRLKLNDLEEALAYMASCLDNALQTDDFIAQACAYRGMGEVYLATGKSNLAQEAFDRSVQLFEEAGDRIGAEEVRGLNQVSKSTD